MLGCPGACSPFFGKNGAIWCILESILAFLRLILKKGCLCTQVRLKKKKTMKLKCDLMVSKSGPDFTRDRTYTVPASGKGKFQLDLNLLS